MTPTWVDASGAKSRHWNTDADDQVAGEEERDRRRDDEERDASEPRVQPRHDGPAVAAVHRGQRRQLGRGDAHPEQRDRQQVQHLGVRQRGERAERQQRGDGEVDVAGDLHATATGDDLPETAHDLAARRGRRTSPTACSPRVSRSTLGSCTANCSTDPAAAPTAIAVASGTSAVVTSAVADQRGDDRDVPRRRARRRTGRTGGGS